MAKSPRAEPAQTVSTWEPEQSPVKRVMEKSAKDPKKVAAGRVGAAAQTAAQNRLQNRLLEQLQAAKESLRPGDPKEADSKDRERTDERPRQQSNKVTGPLMIGACLARGALTLARLLHSRATQIGPACCRGPVDSAPKVQDKPPQLKACPDPHYME